MMVRAGATVGGLAGGGKRAQTQGRAAEPGAFAIQANTESTVTVSICPPMRRPKGMVVEADVGGGHTRAQSLSTD
jgi:hypothetical protein